MNDPPKADVRRRALTQLLLTMIAVLVLAAVGVTLVITNAGFGGLFFLGFGILLVLILTSGLWVGLTTYAVFALSNETRLRTLEVAYPGATLVHAVITRPVLRQLRELAARLGKPRPKLRARRYVTLAFDSSSIVFYVGSAHPTASLTLSKSTLTSVSLTTTPAAGKQLPSLRMVFAVDPEQPIVLVPVYWPGVVPKAVPQETLLSQIAAINPSRV